MIIKIAKTKYLGYLVGQRHRHASPPVPSVYDDDSDLNSSGYRKTCHCMMVTKLSGSKKDWCTPKWFSVFLVCDLSPGIG